MARFYQGGHRNGWKRHNLREMRAGPTATVLFLDRLSLLLKRCLERERVPLVNILIVRMPGAPSDFSFSFPCQLKTMEEKKGFLTTLSQFVD